LAFFLISCILLSTLQPDKLSNLIDLPLIILGTGGAGMAASIYALRYRIDHVLLGELPGGTLTTAHLVENYPGYKSILGNDLVEKYVEHVKYLGGEITVGKATKIERDGNYFVVTTAKEMYRSKALIYTLGSTHKHLGVPGEKAFDGKGVSYCATCDGFFFRDKTVAIVGGGDSAATGVLVLMNLAKKTYMLVRGDKLRAEPIWVEQIQANPNVEILYNTSVVEIKGSTKVESVSVQSSIENRQSTILLDGVFVEIGLHPSSQLAKDIGVETDAGGYVKVGEDMSTNIPGFFAAGDVTTGSARFMQLVTAASEGVIATYGAYQYLNKVS